MGRHRKHESEKAIALTISLPPDVFRKLKAMGEKSSQVVARLIEEAK